MDLCQSKFLAFYLLPEPMVSPLDMFGPRVVSHVLCKVDGAFIVVIESEFIFSNSQLSDEVLHPDYFLAGFYNRHILRFRG